MTEGDPCYLCGGDSNATIGNPELSIDIGFLNLTGITDVTCQQAFVYGLKIIATKCMCSFTIIDIKVI
jgi:hypothetical protein